MHSKYKSGYPFLSIREAGCNVAENEVVCLRIFLNSPAGPLQAVLTNKRLITLQPRAKIIIYRWVWLLISQVEKIPLIGKTLKLFLWPVQYIYGQLTNRDEKLALRLFQVDDQELIDVPKDCKQIKIQNFVVKCSEYPDIMRNMRSLRISSQVFSLSALQFNAALVTFFPKGKFRYTLSRIFVGYHFVLQSNSMLPNLAEFAKENQEMLRNEGYELRVQPRYLEIVSLDMRKNTLASSVLATGLFLVALTNALISSRGFTWWGQQALDDTFFWGIPLVAASLWAYIHCRSFRGSFQAAISAWLGTWLIVAPFYWFVYPDL